MQIKSTYKSGCIFLKLSLTPQVKVVGEVKSISV